MWYGGVSKSMRPLEINNASNFRSMKGQKRNTILDRTRPRIKTPAIGVIAQQGTDGKWTTVVQKGIVRICTINVGTMKGRSREVVEMLARRRVDICCGWERRTREVE